jgi:hypothetical protein
MTTRGGEQSAVPGDLAQRFLNKLAQHRLSHFKVSDNAVLHGTDRLKVHRGFTEHLFGFGAHVANFMGVDLTHYHRRLIQNQAVKIPHIDETVGSTEVNTDIR